MIALPAPGERIGSGRRAEVFTAGADALKLFADGEPAATAFAEAGRQALAVDAGAPAPAVRAVGQVKGRWGILMARCESPALALRMQQPGADLPRLVEAMAALHRDLHRRDGSRLPGQRAKLRRDIGAAPALGPALQAALIARLDTAGPDPGRLCHGDFHPFNILGTPDSPVVIDWADAVCGTPEADACRSVLLLRSVSRDLADRYLRAYAGGDPERVAAILGWMPIIAAARLAEGVADESGALLQLASGAAD